MLSSEIPNNVRLIINLIPLAIIALLFIGVKLAPKKQFHEDYLDLKYTKNLQGFAMLFIMYHHMIQLVSNYGWFDVGVVTVFNRLGILFTAIFFFCSGYGLIRSIEVKKDYLKTFLIKRLPAVIVPFYVANTLYIVILRYVLKVNDMPEGYLWKAFSGWKIYNNQLWFPIEIVVLYIAFFIIFKFIKKREIAMGVMTIFVIGLIIYSMSLGRDKVYFNTSWFAGEWWYNSTICFVVGMYYAQYKEQFERLFKKKYVITLIASAILCKSTYIIAGEIAGKFGYTNDNWTVILWKSSLINLIADSAQCIFFVLFLVIISMKLRFDNKVISFIGKISFELYMTHNIFLFLFFRYLNIPNKLVFMLLTYLCSIVFAYLVYLLDRGLLKLIGKVSSRNA